MFDPDNSSPKPIAETEGEQYKYWAFLSYSHQDKKWADWLHKSLETYRVPKRMIGRETRIGSVPRRLFPVFRDVEELPTSASLSESITTALRQSRCLIVICSPRSAQSRWVNEEVLAYKRLGRSDRILCLIVAGEPNAADKPQLGLEECFPPAVRFAVGPDGAPSDRRVEPIAADVRLGGYVKYDAKLKVVAGLLGLGFDELKRRDLRRRRRRQAGFAAIALLVLLAAGWWIIQAGRQARQLQRKADAVHELEGKIQNLPFPRMSGKYSPEEIEALKSRRDILLHTQSIADTRVRMGMSATGDLIKATYDLFFAEAELAWAEGDLNRALNKLEQAADQATQYVKLAVRQYEMGVKTHADASAAEKMLADTNLALVRMKQVISYVKGPLRVGDLPDPAPQPAAPAPPEPQIPELELPELPAEHSEQEPSPATPQPAIPSFPSIPELPVPDSSSNSENQNAASK